MLIEKLAVGYLSIQIYIWVDLDFGLVKANTRLIINLKRKLQLFLIEIVG